LRFGAVLAVVMLLGGCPTSRMKKAATVHPGCSVDATTEEAARALDLAAQNRRALERFEQARRGGRPDPTAQAAALKEARELVERAKVASADEQPRLERRAGGLLRVLRGF
jgi:hypothetical protein